MPRKRKDVEKVVVTSGPRAPADNTIAKTPPGDKDLHVVVMGWARQAGVRTVRTYLQCLLGFLPAMGLANTAADAVGADARIFVGDFWDALVIAASLSVAPAAVAFLHNTIELLASLDHPETRA